jgi:GNAT superfamily N-acetyltransferase
VARVEVRRAEPHEAPVVAMVLTEAAQWAERSGIPMWRPDETSVEAVRADVAGGLFHLALVDGEPQGTLRFQLTDPLYWPDLEGEDSAFVHRLAVRRGVAGKGVSTALLDRAPDHARPLGRRTLPFRYHSDFQAGPHLVARYVLDLTPPR